MKESSDPEGATEEKRVHECPALPQACDHEPRSGDNEEGKDGCRRVPWPRPRPCRPVKSEVHYDNEHRQHHTDKAFGQDRQRAGNAGQHRRPGVGCLLPSQIPIHRHREEQREGNVLLGYQTLIEKLS